MSEFLVSGEIRITFKNVPVHFDVNDEDYDDAGAVVEHEYSLSDIVDHIDDEDWEVTNVIEVKESGHA